jgi:hypothetical protein
MDPITAAITYADRPEHNGSGYTLIIGFTNGKELEFDVHRNQQSIGQPAITVLRYRNSIDEAFINTEHVVVVRVSWS